MPLPNSLARLNRALTNKITRPFAARLPGFAVLHHTGRVTGTAYATPLNAWRRKDDVVVALTYGDEVDWLANARANSPSSLVMGGSTFLVGIPRDLAGQEGMASVPSLVRVVLRALDVDDFVAFPVEG
ncbi:MAG: nitroreductase family deazaflavin-dependent oxidoreductase [Acidimicrobiia bacterium]